MGACLPEAGYTQAGLCDTTFGQHGIVRIHLNDGGFTQLVVQPDNRIVGASCYDFYISRYKADGHPDSTFGSGGFVHGLNMTQTTEVYDMKLQDDGRIVAAGAYMYNWYPEEWHAAVVRLTAGGWPDPSFANGGKIVDSDEPVYRVYTSVVIQPDKKILVAGTGRVGGVDKIVVCRATPQGNRDVTFGNNGQVLAAMGSGNHACPKMLLLADGKILIAANAVDQGGSHAGIMRLKGNGSPDSSFAVNGKYLDTGVASESDFHGNSFFFNGGGKTVLSCRGSGGHGFLIRFTAGGFPDTTFGSGGRVELPEPGTHGAVSQWDDKIVAGVGGFRLVRLAASGAIDPTFGTNGYQTTRIDPTSFSEQVYALAIQHGGKILAGGVAGIPNPNYPANIYIYSLTRSISGLDCPLPLAKFGYLVTRDSVVNFQDHSSSAIKWHWDFGDGTTSPVRDPEHTYAANGSYRVCLQVSDTCGTSEACDTILVFPQGVVDHEIRRTVLYPNPSASLVTLNINPPFTRDSELEINDVYGKIRCRKLIHAGTRSLDIDLAAFPAGIYGLAIRGDGQYITRKFIRLNR